MPDQTRPHLVAATGGPFDPGRFYTTTDPALRLVGTPGTMAQWRSSRRGPRFYKFGGRILYAGSDLNAWFAAHLVETNSENAS